MRPRRPTAFSTAVAARAFYAAFQKLSGTALPAGAGDFRLLDRKAIDAMNRMRERVRFNKGLFAWMGFRSIGVPFHVPPRQAAAARAGGRASSCASALDGITSFTTIPLRRVVLPRADRCRCSRSCYAVVMLLKTLIYGVDVPGFPTLIISVHVFRRRAADLARRHRRVSRTHV